MRPCHAMLRPCAQAMLCCAPRRLSSATPDLPSPSDPSSKLDQSNTAQAVRASVSYMNDSVALSERTEGTGSLPMEQLKLLEVITDASPAQGSVDLQVDGVKGWS